MSKTTVVTGKVRLSYPHLFVPHAMQEGQKKKYSCSLIIPKTDIETINAINAAIGAAYEAGKQKLGSTPLTVLKTPLRDGDLEKPDKPEYANSMFINCSSVNPVTVVRKNETGQFVPVEDTVAASKEQQVYAGCYVSAQINIYPYKVTSAKGIAAGLNAILFLQDGEKFGHTVDVNEAFSRFSGEMSFMN